MSYLRPVVLQADSLRTLCVDAWMRHLLALVRDSYVISRGKRGKRGGKEVKAARMEMMEEAGAEGEERRAWHILQDCLKVRRYTFTY